MCAASLHVASLEGAPAHGFGTPLSALKRVRLFIQRHSECTQLGYLVVTGPTRTNVNDYRANLIT